MLNSQIQASPEAAEMRPQFPPVPWAISLIANQNYQLSSAFMGGWKVKVDTKYRTCIEKIS